MAFRVLFVCYGNICRSPVAEYVFRSMAEKEGLSGRLECESCATSGENLGCRVDSRSAKVLSEHGMSCEGKRARVITVGDFRSFDLIVCMDRMNLRFLERIRPPDASARISMLLDYAGGGEVDDPWYTGDFRRAYSEIEKGCAGLLKEIRMQERFRRGCSCRYRCPAATRSNLFLKRSLRSGTSGRRPLGRCTSRYSSSGRRTIATCRRS